MSKTAADIVEKLGGAANIESLSHCATRLRFQLRDASGVKQSDLESVSGVMGAVPQAGNRYQVVIGGGVQTVYNEIKALPGMGGGARRRRCRRHQGRRARQGPARQVRLAGLVLRVPVRLVPPDPRRAARCFAVHHLHGADEHPQGHPELGRPAYRTAAVLAVRQPDVAERLRLPAADGRLQRVEEIRRRPVGRLRDHGRRHAARASPR